jgi:RNA polymerase sigma factor (sigma-70 family)
MQDSVTAYFNEIGRIPLLTTEQEIQLGRQIQEMRAFQATGREPQTQAERRVIRNGQRAMNRMMESNLRLVVTIARKYYRMCQTLELMDVISLGNIGLAKAAEKFDPSLGYKFSTYAYWWIWQSISRGITDQDRLIRLPAHQVEKLGKIRKHQRLNPSVSVTEAAAATGVETADLDLALRSMSLASLDQMVVEDGDPLVTMIADERQSPDDELDRATGVDGLRQAMEYLQPRDRRVVEMRFGEEMTFAEIARRLGVSRELVRQRQKKALNRLRLLLEVAA